MKGIFKRFIKIFRAMPDSVVTIVTGPKMDMVHRLCKSFAYGQIKSRTQLDLTNYELWLHAGQAVLDFEFVPTELKDLPKTCANQKSRGYLYAIYVMDLTDELTFDDMDPYIETIFKEYNAANVIIFMDNIDKNNRAITKKRTSSWHDANAPKYQNGSIGMIEGSYEDNINIDNTFYAILNFQVRFFFCSF